MLSWNTKVHTQQLTARMGKINGVQKRKKKKALKVNLPRVF